MTRNWIVGGRDRRLSVIVAAFGLTLALGAPAAHAAPALVLTVDTEAIVNGVELACTGIGQTREEARWQSYAVRVEFSNARNEYLVDGAIAVRDSAGRELLSVRCDAPWILLRLPKGAYRIEATLPGSVAKPRSAAVASPAQGQMRVVMQFPDAS